MSEDLNKGKDLDKKRLKRERRTQALLDAGKPALKLATTSIESDIRKTEFEARRGDRESNRMLTQMDRASLRRDFNDKVRAMEEDRLREAESTRASFAIQGVDVDSDVTSRIGEYNTLIAQRERDALSNQLLAQNLKLDLELSQSELEATIDEARERNARRREMLSYLQSSVNLAQVIASNIPRGGSAKPAEVKDTTQGRASAITKTRKPNQRLA